MLKKNKLKMKRRNTEPTMMVAGSAAPSVPGPTAQRRRSGRGWGGRRGRRRYEQHGFLNMVQRASDLTC